VVDGEKSCFTYAPDLAQKTRELIETAQPGIYHVVNTGAVTWYEATKKLFEIAGVASQVHPVSPDAFPRPAKRPPFSVLISKNTEPLRSWESAVREYLGGS
jgi:dTDP-4-dehydrorhamnose reductase